MEKFIQFFIVALIVGLVGFSSDLGILTQRIQGSLETSRLENNTVTEPNTNDSEVETSTLANTAATEQKLNSDIKLVTIEREKTFDISQAGTVVLESVQCNSDEVVTGGGFHVGGGRNAGSVVVESNHRDQNGWLVVMFSRDAVIEGNIVYAECAHLQLAS